MIRNNSESAVQHIQPFQLRRVADKYDTETLRFSFQSNYCFLFLDDEQGLVCLVTDFGTFSYFWPPSVRNEDLKSFFCTADKEYLANKLSPSSSRHRRWNPEETRKNIEAQLPELFDADREEELEDALDDLENTTLDMGPDIFLETAGRLWNHLPELYEELVYDEDFDYLMLKYRFIPFIQEYLKAMK